MLRLHAKCIPGLINQTVLALDALEVVGRVKLKARFRCKHLQNSAAFWFINARGQAQLSQWFVNNPVLVIAAADLDLLVCLVDSGANSGRRSEIKRGPVHWSQLAGWDLAAVSGRELIGLNHHDVAHYVTF